MEKFSLWLEDGTGDYESFLNQIRENPNDRTLKRVFADWLEDNGYKNHADRLRWWQDAVDHADSNEPTGRYPYMGDRILPHWGRRLNLAHKIRSLVEGDSALKEIPEFLDAIMTAEMYAYGFETKEDLKRAADRINNLHLQRRLYPDINTLQRVFRTSRLLSVLLGEDPSFMGNVLGDGHNIRDLDSNHAAHTHSLLNYGMKNPAPKNV